MKPLRDLKEAMLTNSNFKDCWNYFFDHWAESEEFLRMGKEVKNPDLQIMIERVAQQILGKPQAKASNFLIIELTDDHFYHGGFSIDNTLGAFMFFKDDDLGMLNLMPSMDRREILFGRFSATTLLQAQPPKDPKSLN